MAAFLRKLWSSPDLMEQFSESRAGRKKVLSRFNLTARHARMLLDGCVRDIVLELAGGGLAGGRLAESTTVVVNCEYGTADVTCGHPGCEAFIATVAKGQRFRKKR